jgi:hypothetical protein
MPLTKQFKSAVTEGAAFTLASPGRGLRTRVEYDLAEVRHEQTLIAQAQYSLIPEQYRDNLEALNDKLEALSPEDWSKLTRLRIMADLAQQRVRLAYAKVMLTQFELPGENMSVDDLLENGPVDFTDEILSKVDALLGLTKEEQKNSSSPSTSPAPVDGQTKVGDGTAQPVSDGATT